MKKIALSAAFAASFMCVLGFQQLSDHEPDYNEDNIVGSYERNPPTLVTCQIRKIMKPEENGPNLTVFLKFEDDGRPMPYNLRLYATDDLFYDFKSSGDSPDASRHNAYSADIRTDLEDLLGQLNELQSNLHAAGSVTVYNGRTPVELTHINDIDFSGFRDGKVIDIPLALLNATDCSTLLTPEHSLLVTSLDVVEDPARTFNIIDTSGNPNGEWNFGQLVKNMVNSSTPGDVRAFLKSWVSQWMSDQVINGDTVAARKDAFVHLIGPWIRRAHNDSSFSVTEMNWESKWNATNENDLIKYAPFKLMAIVNRIDTRGAMAFSFTEGNAGETRFIYTLIAPYGNGTTAAGQPPVASNQDFGASPVVANRQGFMDWKGMNVILEYSNVQHYRCDLSGFAHRWYDLSAYALGSAQYNDSLASITRTVTAAGAMPSRPTGSALARIRTNERIFQHNNIASGPAWDRVDWEMRQFEIDPVSRKLAGRPVFNTPRLRANWADNIAIGAYYGQSSQAEATAITDWLFTGNNNYLVSRERHVLPARLSAASAVVDAELVHYFDLDWIDAGNVYDPATQFPGMPKAMTDSFASLLRHNLSLNTCQGCHAGETKTLFTHIKPRGYGATANYAGSVPDADYGVIDTRGFAASPGFPGFMGWTSGRSYFSVTDYPNYTLPPNPRDNGNQYLASYSPIVSAFLSGRSVSGTVRDYQDDAFDDRYNRREDGADQLFGKNRNFIIFDPSNGSATSPYNNMRRTLTYNDLERRKKDLCQLVNFDCNRLFLGMLNGVTMQVLPRAAH